ncbi:ATP-dependent RNA helicase dbp9 [Frankliniella fusca]|uniref:ATP-dependent RNA helicase dbp9 n=1 Tax=Frankliniella fusca TaxID=407009 RepID=A0AAE1LTK2_9NEOP|nr:ATP-dependent RNA helicase dbp9 [Frankliniella fusca]
MSSASLSAPTLRCCPRSPTRVPPALPRSNLRPTPGAWPATPPRAPTGPSGALRARVKRLNQKVDESMKLMSRIREEQVEETIKLLPPEQQCLVKACSEASKQANTKGCRCATDWIYECMLMRIKAPALYEKLRRENKIALPSKRKL